MITNVFTDYYTAAKVAELQAAFNLVVPSPNWKVAIDVTVVVSVAELGAIQEAVPFYTGAVVRHTMSLYPVGRRGQDDVFAVRIQAAGYYATIGA